MQPIAGGSVYREHSFSTAETQQRWSSGPDDLHHASHSGEKYEKIQYIPSVDQFLM